MALSINTALKNVELDAVVDSFDVTPPGVLRIYDGAAPADANAALGAQNLLAEVTLPNPSFAAAAAGSVDKTGTWEDLSINASGTAAWFRLLNSDGTYVLQGTVTVTSGGGDMEVDDVNFVAGGSFTVTSFNLS